MHSSGFTTNLYCVIRLVERHAADPTFVVRNNVKLFGLNYPSMLKGTMINGRRFPGIVRLHRSRTSAELREDFANLQSWVQRGSVAPMCDRFEQSCTYFVTIQFCPRNSVIRLGQREVGQRTWKQKRIRRILLSVNNARVIKYISCTFISILISIHLYFKMIRLQNFDTSLDLDVWNLEI